MTDDELKDLYREDDDWDHKRTEAQAEKDGAKECRIIYGDKPRVLVCYCGTCEADYTT